MNYLCFIYKEAYIILICWPCAPVHYKTLQLALNLRQNQFFGVKFACSITSKEHFCNVCKSVYLLLTEQLLYQHSLNFERSESFCLFAPNFFSNLFGQFFSSFILTIVFYRSFHSPRAMLHIYAYVARLQCTLLFDKNLLLVCLPISSLLFLYLKLPVPSTQTSFLPSLPLSLTFYPHK